MANKNWIATLEDIGYWIKNHWFLCLVIIGFIVLWDASEVTIRESLTGNVYPSLLLLLPILIAFLLSFIVIIYSDMAT